jgi:phosphatidylserine/phosphatidylglycerophosphate/cardiolipin synthase-like enzyme
LVTFPSLGAIKARIGASSPEPLQAFANAAQNAQDRILILDDYLFKPKDGQAVQSRYDQILRWFPDGLVANDIRILTNAHGNKTEHELIRRKFAERAAAINDRSRNRVGIVTIAINFTLNTEFPYVHDRFAIVDDELWHFGATVGGLHEALSAVTRGWDSDQHDALRFFNDAWRGDARSLGKGRHG